MPAATKIKIGDREYELAPMNLKTMSAHKEFLKELMSRDFDVIENIPRFQALVKDALSRTVPDITDAEIESGVDMGNIPDITTALFQVSGFVSKAGETKPGKVSKN